MAAATMYMASPWTWTPAAPVGPDGSLSLPPVQPTAGSAKKKVGGPQKPRGPRPRVPPPVTAALRCLRRAPEPAAAPPGVPRRVQRLEPLRTELQSLDREQAPCSADRSQEVQRVEEDILEEALLEPRSCAASGDVGAECSQSGEPVSQHATEAEVPVDEDQHNLPLNEEDVHVQVEVDVCPATSSSASLNVQKCKDDVQEEEAANEVVDDMGQCQKRSQKVSIAEPEEEKQLAATGSGQAVETRSGSTVTIKHEEHSGGKYEEVQLKAESQLAASAFGSARKCQRGKNLVDPAFAERAFKHRRRSTRKSIASHGRKRDSRRFHASSIQGLTERDQVTDRFWRVYDGLDPETFEHVRPVWRKNEAAAIDARQDLLKRQDARTAKLHRLIRCGRLPEAAKEVVNKKGFAAKMERTQQKVSGALEMMIQHRRDLSETRRALEKVVNPKEAALRGRALSFCLQAGLSARFQDATAPEASSSSSESYTSSEEMEDWDMSDNEFNIALL